MGYEIPVYTTVQGPVGEYVMDWAMRRGLVSPWWDIKRRSLENIDTIPAKGFKSVSFYQRQILKK
ncbi:MAG: hypothetical protein V3T95_01145, partial [Acidobacteriota bacterium]